MIGSNAFEAGQRTALLELWQKALAAADISGKYAPFLPEIPKGRTVVIGAGKGAAAMAREFDAVWKGPLSGAVVTRHGYGLPSYAGRIEVLEAGHPVPDDDGVAAAIRMAGILQGHGRDDLVIALISGGASALLVGLPEGVTLEDKQLVTRQLLASGASISEMNTVRKHISTIKGGRLANLAGAARVITFAVSDIPGDDIAAIGSGPTIFDGTTAGQALTILQKYRIVLPESIETHLAKAPAEEWGPPTLRQTDTAYLVVTPAGSLAAAAQGAKALGYEPINLGDDLEGEARDLGRDHARLALSLLKDGRRVCLISGGETTVTVRGRGKGGRNSEYLLGMALELKGQEGIAALAADTDGVDGSEDNAGALVFASTLSRAALRGVDVVGCLQKNDSYSFFFELGDLLVTGPTCTNVNDFRAILIDPFAEKYRNNAE